jgi:DNA processing protein
VLDRLAGERERLDALLGLPDASLIEALGGRRRESLRERHLAFAVESPSQPDPRPGALPGGLRVDIEPVCRHDPRYPRALCGTASPWMLDVAGGAARLAQLASEPVVALLGSRRASDYGREMAQSLARGLAASGVTVASGLVDGIAAAAQTGVQDAGAGSIAVLGDGLGVSRPASTRTLYSRITRGGCALSELPRDCPGRRWGDAAAARIVVELAALVVVIEAREEPRELAGAETARALGRPLAVLPGRVTSPLASGPHALLLEGASPIRHTEDVLELLYRESRPQAPSQLPAPDRRVALEPRLRRILELVGSGADTPDRLAAAGAEPSGLPLALTELELLGLLGRGENGRYVPRRSLPETRSGQ